MSPVSIRTQLTLNFYTLRNKKWPLIVTDAQSITCLPTDPWIYTQLAHYINKTLLRKRGKPPTAYVFHVHMIT